MTTTSKWRWPLLLLALAWGLSAQAAVPAGISGSWFNPAQGGHGFSVQVLDEQRAIAFWFVYTPSGKPIHLYIDGTIANDRIVGTAYYHEGMRFGAFDPSKLVESVWGEVELTFLDCEHADLRYDARGPAGAGYGAGRMPLQRLSRIGAQACTIGKPGVIYPATYEAIGLRPGDVASSVPMAAAIDPDGRLWATARVPNGPNAPVGATPSPLVIGETTGRRGDRASIAVKVLEDAAFRIAPALTPAYDDTELALNPFNEPAGSVSIDAPSFRELFFSTRLDAFVQTAFFEPAALAGMVFRADFLGNGVTDRAYVRVYADGKLCVSAFNDIGEAAACAWHGKVTASHQSYSFFDFTLARASDDSTRYRGRGWVQYQPITRQPASLVLVGADATSGLGFVAGRTAP